jgi:pimeloyl-ACP methyl ester carboxylesterase
MRLVGALAGALVALAIAPTGAAAGGDAPVYRWSLVQCGRIDVLACAPSSLAGTPAQRAAPGRLPRTAATAVVSDVCAPEAVGAVCGHVDVPLDRAHSGAGTLPIAFELYLHSEPGPAVSAILVNIGGPGLGTLFLRDAALFFFGALLDRHDLLLIDDRGRGQSAAIGCPDLQHGTAPILAAAQACAAQLGPAAQRYGTGDIAKDVEAVRAALGYDKVDFYGASYGGADISAYATRFGEHLRSLVLDAPWGTPYRDLFTRDAQRVHADMRRVGLLCRRSPSCSQLQREPVERVEKLARRLRQQPVTGTALDADGQSHTLTVDPPFLLVHVLDNEGPAFVITGELPAAAESLRRGDPAPLLRLSAETDFPIPGDSGDPTLFSSGALAATFCVDNQFPWSAGAPLNTRLAEWDASVRAASDRPFAPFRADEVLRGQFDEHDMCLPWPGPTTASPIVEPDARYPRVPTLVLDGDLDARVPLEPSRQVADLFPGSRFVPVAGAGHATLSYSPCAAALMAEWIATLQLADTSCAATPLTTYPAVGRFPRTAAESPPATPRAGGRGRHANTRDLRVTRVAVDTALDAVKRGMLGSGDGPGLRGGTFHTETDYATFWTTTLHATRFASDVAVNGTLHWSPDGTLDAELTIDGPGKHDGTLNVTGSWLAPGPAQPLSLTGTLHGRSVTATVPSA